MAEPAHNRGDVSEIRLPKRLIRISAGFVFGWSVLMALVLQFVTYQVKAATVSLDFRVVADSQGFVLLRRPDPRPTKTGFNFRSSPRVTSNGVEGIQRWLALAGKPSEPARLLPGVNLYADDFRPTDHFAVTIHHFWLICISAVVFLATHAQSKRSARIPETQKGGHSEIARHMET
jgi:hypothetical protein